MPKANADAIKIYYVFVFQWAFNVQLMQGLGKQTLGGAATSPGTRKLPVI